MDKRKQMVWYLTVYPVFLGLVAMVAGLALAKRALDKWRDSLRDEIYLLGEVLCDLDENGRQNFDVR